MALRQKHFQYGQQLFRMRTTQGIAARQRMARWEVRRSRSAVVSLGCLIRGDTPHFDVLSRSVASALAHLNAEQDVPIAFGVLTCDDRAQALARAGGRGGNAGREAARAAIQMARLRPGRSSNRSRAGAR